MALFGFGRKPSASPSGVQPAAPKPTGIFGGKNNDYRTFRDLKRSVQKAPDVSVPGFSGKLYKSDRIKAAERFEGYAGKYFGKKYGISLRDVGSTRESSSLLGKMWEDARMAKRKGDWGRAKQLGKDIKIFEQWKKGF